MQTYTTETSISNELLEGEQLLWSGSPNPGGKMVKAPRNGVFIAGLIYAILGFFFLILGFILNIVLPSSDGFNPFFMFFVMGGVFGGLGILVLSIGYFVRFQPKNTFYAITDRRVIILRGGRNLHAVSYGKQAISQIQRFERPDGSGDLIFAGNAWVYGASASNVNYGTYNAGRQGAFTSIPNVRQVEQKLLRMLNEA